jgi:transposase InsO family protein
MISPSWPFAM